MGALSIYVIVCPHLDLETRKADPNRRPSEEMAVQPPPPPPFLSRRSSHPVVRLLRRSPSPRRLDGPVGRLGPSSRSVYFRRGGQRPLGVAKLSARLIAEQRGRGLVYLSEIGTEEMEAEFTVSCKCHGGRKRHDFYDGI